jgi:hypothetical protein
MLLREVAEQHHVAPAACRGLAMAAATPLIFDPHDASGATCFLQPAPSGFAPARSTFHPMIDGLCWHRHQQIVIAGMHILACAP